MTWSEFSPPVPTSLFIFDHCEIKHKKTLVQFWKDFNLLDAIHVIGDSWNDIRASTMRSMWKRLLPHLKNDLVPLHEKDLESNVQHIVQQGQWLNFHELDDGLREEVENSL